MPTRRNFMQNTTAALAVAPFAIPTPANAAPSITRRDVMDMAAGDSFFSDYAKAVQKMHTLNDKRSWLAQAKIHADNCLHGQVGLLHWHRHYIRYFEKICAQLSGNPKFALPYWNWSKNSGRIPAPFFDRPELNVEHWNDPGQYVGKNWGPIDTIGRRGLTKTYGLLDDPVRGGAFTLANINRIKQLPNMDLFEPALEGQPHNTAHIITGATPSGKGGHMGSGLSPLDPIFWLHHCMVDRVWAEWQAVSSHITPDPAEDYSGQFVEANGNPAQGATSAKAMATANLDYTYDTLVPSPVIAPAQVALLLNGQGFKSLNPLLGSHAARIIGSGVNSLTSRQNAETPFSISVPTLSGLAAEFRAIEKAGLIPGNRKIVAKLTDVVAPDFGDLIVNVFVNCPYLTPTTQYSDPHYAGTFSFFGRAKGMKGMEGMSSPTFLIDITAPVLEAGLAPDKIKVQLMPVSARANSESTTNFRVGKIDIIST